MRVMMVAGEGGAKGRGGVEATLLSMRISGRYTCGGLELHDDICMA
jgi:hypothetical protein